MLCELYDLASAIVQEDRLPGLVANDLCVLGQLMTVFYVSISPAENEKLGLEDLLELCSSELLGVYDPFNTVCVCVCTCAEAHTSTHMRAHLSKSTIVLTKRISCLIVTIYSDDNCTAI